MEKNQKVFTENVVNIQNRNRETDLSVSAVASQTAALAAGIYHVTSTVDCYIKVSTTANDVTTNTGYLLLAYNTVPFRIPDRHKIGAISAVSGTIYIHQVY